MSRSEELWGSAIMGFVAGAMLSFFVGMAIFTVAGRGQVERDAVKAGVARYVPGTHGESKFEFIKPQESR